MLTGHYFMGRHAERMELPSNGFCRGCKPTEEEKTLAHFLFQCPSPTRCRCRFLTRESLSAWRSYHQTFRLVFQCFKCVVLALKTCSCLVWRNLISTETAFICGIKTGRYECSSELLVSKLPLPPTYLYHNALWFNDTWLYVNAFKNNTLSTQKLGFHQRFHQVQLCTHLTIDTINGQRQSTI